MLTRNATLLLMLSAAMAAANAAAGAPATDGSRDGELHFTEFNATCLATDGRVDAVKQIAEAQGWSGRVEKKANATLNWWEYRKGGRSFKVLVISDSVRRSDLLEPRVDDGLEGLPLRACEVRTDASHDLDAIAAMRKLLNSPGCDAPKVDGYARWSARGAGYLVSYLFSRLDERDQLYVSWIGSEKTLSSVDVKRVCT